MKLPIGKIICGDCEEIIKNWKIDFQKIIIITDPPYPDFHTKKYNYRKGILAFLKFIDCRQIIFWSAKVDFPLNYTAIHIWDKVIDCASYYERIFERNGQRRYKIYRCHPVNSWQSAQGLRDIWTGHKSQKPMRVMKKLITDFSIPGDIILDPFCGSGSTCAAAKMLGRDYIGIEISNEWSKFAKDRLQKIRKDCKLGIFKQQKRKRKRRLFDE